MKKAKIFFSAFVLSLVSLVVSAQDSTGVSFTVNADLVSRFVWRGFDYGNAPAVQPTLEANYKNFTLGAWGSQSISSNTGGLEADLFASYSFNFGLSVGITDYHFHGESLILAKNLPDTTNTVIIPERSGDYFDFENTHFLEANLDYEIKNWYVSLNYMFYNASDDIYAEIGYNYKNLTLFVGGGNEVYTSDGNFKVCNTGFTIARELRITENYSLPVFGTFVINPDLEQVHMLFGVNL